MPNTKNNDRLSSLLDKKLSEVNTTETKTRNKHKKNSAKLNVAASRRKGLKTGEIRTTIIVRENQMAMLKKIWYLKSSQASALNPVKIKDLYEEMFDLIIERYQDKIQTFEAENGQIPLDFKA